ncbi:MAG: acyl-CoA dehydrogenase [Chloroflexi bacterium]|nr:acyl-CoA dehydrogenase [Chloroflexota bacterium]
MIDFKLTEEQELVRKLAHDFAVNEMRPVARYYDETEEFPWPIVEKAHELGLLNSVIPEEYGGVGADRVTETLIAEELFYGCAGMGTSLMANNLALTPIVIAGTEEQKERFLTPFTEEPLMASFALTEPEAGSDAAGIRTRAVRDGDYYIINGTKQFITNGSVASLYTVFATLDPSLRHKGIIALVVPRDTPGISIGKKEHKMGQRASDTAQVVFEDVRVPVANRLGEEGEGFKIAMKTLDNSRAGIAACAVGIARAAYDDARKYALERKQFGQPIANFQAIQFMLADMAIKIETARLAVWYAAWRADQGLPHTKESSIAKAYATDMAMEVTTDAVQIFGGYGYTREFMVEKYMRDAKLMQIYEGTNQIQRLVIARHILKELM